MSVNRIFGANSVTGTGAGALNDISRVALTDGDIAVARDNTLDSIHFYRYDEASADAEVYPTVIRPDDFVSQGVWRMISPQYFMENLIVDVGSKVFTNEIVGNGSNLSLGYQDGTIDIVVGGSAITLTKAMSTNSQITSTLATGTAPFVVASTTMVGNLTVEFIGDVGGDSAAYGDVVLTDGTHPFTAPVNGASTEFDAVAGDLDGELATKPYVDWLHDQPNQISHTVLENLDSDDHTQYILVDGSRAFDVTSFYPSVNNSATPPTADAHLTTKKYVDDEITALGLGGSGLYLLRDGSLTATGKLDYSSDFSGTFGTRSITDVGYVTNAIANHSAIGDPHTAYLKADATRVTTARLHSSASDGLAINSQTAYTYITRSDIDFWLQDAFLATEQAYDDTYRNVTGATYLSNIVRRDTPKGGYDYKPSDVETNVHNLVTYGYIYERFGGFAGITTAVGAVTGIDINTTGTGGFTPSSYSLYSTTTITGTGTGLTVRAYADDTGTITNVFVQAVGSGYDVTDTVDIIGGNNDTRLNITSVFVEGGLHGDLGELNLDQHTQYSLVDGTRPFSGTVGGVYPVSSSDLATKQYVDDVVVGGGITHDGFADTANSIAHDNYMFVDPQTYSRGFESQPFMDSTAFPNPALAPTQANHLATKAYIDETIGGDFIKADGSVTLLNNQIYTPKTPQDYFLNSSGNELVNRDYIDTYLGLALVSDTDEYMGYLRESFVINNPAATVINDGTATAVELNISSVLKGTLERANVVLGGGTAKFFVYDSTSATYPDSFTVVDSAAGIGTTSITETRFTVPSEETNNGTGTGLILRVDVAGTLTVPNTTLLQAGYGYTANDDVALDYVEGFGSGSGGILHVLTVGTRGEISTYDFSTGNGNAGSGYSLNDELIPPNADSRVFKVIGDVEYFEIVDSGTGLSGADGTYDFEVPGDGTGSTWRLTIASNTISGLEQLATGSGYTNVGTSQAGTIDQSFFGIGTGTLEILPMVVGDVLDIAFQDKGFGYTSALYVLSDATKASFQYSGFGTSGSFDTLDVDFINPLDERVEVMHYNAGTLVGNVGASPFTASAGNVINSITFDNWGHIVDIGEAGIPATPWSFQTGATFTSVAGNGYAVDTSSSGVTIDLPASFSIGDTITIDDYNKNSSVNNITVQANGGGNFRIENADDTLTIDVDGARVILTFLGNDGTVNYGWRYKVI